jgi:type II secretory pathway component HofQ
MDTNLWGGVGLGFALALGAATAAPAQDAGAARKVERLDLDVKDQSLAEVVRYIRERTGADIVLGEGPHGTRLAEVKPAPIVTVEFENVPWAQALKLVAGSADCLVRREGNRYVVYQPTRITIQFERADLRDVVTAIAAQSGANIVIGSDVPDGLEVSVRLTNVPWQNALIAVVKSVGMTVVHSKGRDLAVLGGRGASLPRPVPLTPAEEAARDARRQDAEPAAKAKAGGDLAAQIAEAEAQVAELQRELAALTAKLAELTKQLRERK